MTEPDSFAVGVAKRAMRTRDLDDIERARRLAETELPRPKQDIAESEQTINFMEAMMALMARHGTGPGNITVTIADLVREGKVSRADLQATGLPDAEIDQMYAASGLTG